MPRWPPNWPTSPIRTRHPDWSRPPCAEFGTVDIVIANAGGPPPGHALDVDDAKIDAALDANLKSAIRLTREAVPVMRKKGWGRVCFITSYSVVQPLPGLALSNMARAGLWAWVKTAAQDLAGEESGITLNLLCPGPHATDRMRELGGDGPMGDPADFGRIAAFLCSRHTAFVNGAALVIDGGATLHALSRAVGFADACLGRSAKRGQRLCQRRKWRCLAQRSRRSGAVWLRATFLSGIQIEGRKRTSRNGHGLPARLCRGGERRSERSFALEDALLHQGASGCGRPVVSDIHVVKARTRASPKFLIVAAARAQRQE